MSEEKKKLTVVPCEECRRVQFQLFQDEEEFLVGYQCLHCGKHEELE